MHNWVKSISPNPLTNDRLAKDGHIITANFPTKDNIPGQSTDINYESFLALECKLFLSILEMLLTYK